MATINGAYVNDSQLEHIMETAHQTSFGIGKFDGYADNAAALPTVKPALFGKTYLVADNSTPYVCDGEVWSAAGIIPVALGAVFYIVENGSVAKEGRFTTKPVYDNPDAPTAATGGACEILEMGANRAPTDYGD
jgi:hypothetical protein